MEETDTTGRRRVPRPAVEVARRLAGASGFRVVTSRGVGVGRLDHIRYRRRADIPDELVIRRSRLLPWRRRVIEFDQVERVEPRTRTVVLR